MADETEEQHPQNAREYLGAIKRSPESPATMGDVVALLEYFGAIAQPPEHAATPFSRPEVNADTKA